MKYYFSTYRVVFLLGTLLYFFSYQNVVQAKEKALPLEVTIAYKNGYDTRTISFSITNISDQNIALLPWGLPFEGEFTMNIFTISTGGKRVQYVGKRVKRGAASESDYLLIAPRRTITVDCDLTKGYDLAAGGVFEIYFSGFIQYGIYDAKDKFVIQSRKVISNSITIDIEPYVSSAKLSKAYTDVVSCSEFQKQVLEAALTEAEKFTDEAVDTLTGLQIDTRSVAGRYLSWFGDYTDSNYSEVVSIYQAMQNTFNTETITFHCDCSTSNYAWVYPDKPYNIHICNSFWNAPVTGTDSQAGTIIHEMSHFNSIAHTDDYVYGQEFAFNLAANNPAEAINNADNFEYFAENNPHLTMSVLTGMTDLFSQKELEPRLKALAYFDTSSFSKDIGEPDHVRVGSEKSAWFSWRSPAAGNVEVSTIGSTFDTLLSVYSGDDLAHLIEIASNDDEPDSNNSRLEFTANKDVIYHIVVDGYGGASGLAYMKLSHYFGDINGDSELSLADVILGLRIFTDSSKFQPVYFLADINSDQRVGMQEVLFALASIATENQK